MQHLSFVKFSGLFSILEHPVNLCHMEGTDGVCVNHFSVLQM